MDTPEKRKQLKALAEEIFEMTKLTSRARAQARKDKTESLTETENVVLDLLSKTTSITVGEIQKAIGVLPAQMSRIIRALEGKGDEAYISCHINPDDRRKIDVSITPDGKKALEAYRDARTSLTMKLLAVLTTKEREDFMRITRKIRDNIPNSLPNN